jgi:hypothetical protein
VHDDVAAHEPLLDIQRGRKPAGGKGTPESLESLYSILNYG